MLAAGGITFANKWLLADKGPDFKILIATGIAAMALAAVENVSPEFAVGLAWIALVTILFTRTSADVPSPVEALAKITGL
jgi:hypothetical protein